MNVVQSPNNNFFGHYYFAFGYKTISINSKLLFMHVSCLPRFLSQWTSISKKVLCKCSALKQTYFGKIITLFYWIFLQIKLQMMEIMSRYIDIFSKNYYQKLTFLRIPTQQTLIKSSYKEFSIVINHNNSDKKIRIEKCKCP